MKNLIIAVAMLITTQAFGSIRNSTKEVDHQVKIADAVWAQCGAHRDLTEVSQVVREDKIDQGITDVYFTTTLNLVVRVDNGVFDHYVATVESLLSDSYDHQAKRWGTYQVLSVSCKMK